MPPLTDIINDLPPELAATEDDQVDDTPVLPDPGESDTPDTPADPGENDDPDPAAAADEDEDDDDYITQLEEDNPAPAVTDKPAVQQPAVTDENTYILNNLQKLTVSVVMAGEDGNDVIKQVQVYGAGDLPRDMKGFATPYEQTLFMQALNAQEQRARELQTEYRNNKARADTETFVQRENKMIADDLTDLRKEGIFPKFKGIPGSKEFNESEGAKMFDKVVAYMNEQNDKYSKDAGNGRAYRHIGFREAYVMVNGPNPKAAEKADMQSRKAAAAKLKGGSGTSTDTRVVSNAPVTNMTDLVAEFPSFAGAGGGEA